MIPFPPGPFNLVYADPPWFYNSRPKSGTRFGGGADEQYLDHDGDGRSTMSLEEIAALPVRDIVARDAYLFMWATWPTLVDERSGLSRLVTFDDVAEWRKRPGPWTDAQIADLINIVEDLLRARTAFDVIESWGFRYVTLGLLWIKVNRGDGRPRFGQGFYTKANSEPCFLGVRGRPWRVLGHHSNLVSQILEAPAPPNAALHEIYAPITRHSEKPAEAREAIVRFCGDIPRVELFTRHRVPGWTAWGNEVGKLDAQASLLEASA